MKIKITLTAILLTLFVSSGFSQKYDTHEVMPTSELRKHLTKEAKQELGKGFSDADLAAFLR